MKRPLILIVLLFASIALISQEIQLTFTGTGLYSNVETVQAKNLSTNDSISFPGDQMLYLNPTGGLEDVSIQGADIQLYPNPFDNSTTLELHLDTFGKSTISVYDIVGQMVTSTTREFDQGSHSFKIRFEQEGIYFIHIQVGNQSKLIKAICSRAGNNNDEIIYSGSFGATTNQSKNFKSGSETYTLGYTEGDVIAFRCKNGRHTSIITDSPTESGEYEIEFVDCTDPDNRTYEVVKIGDQMWMAENMAYLPEVSPPYDTSAIEDRYYVYGYDNIFATQAKATDNYIIYGSLYNWLAAKDICPDNWHLPTDDDWKILEKYLGMDDDDMNRFAHRFSGYIGDQIKSSGGWESDRNGTNITGFGALPAGSIEADINYSFGSYAKFWSSTEHYSGNFINRELYHIRKSVSRFTMPSSSGLSVRCIRNDPRITTRYISNITESTALGGGSIIYPLEGVVIASRGICWSEAEFPSIEDSICENGSGYGEYICDITGLSWGRWYYVRAYYITAEEEVIYGNQVRFVSGGALFKDIRDQAIYEYGTIGYQTWLFENMRYLPDVSDPFERSIDSAHYYVYDYKEDSLQEARASDNYKTYGTLYNFPAALSVCPAGWHLPSDEEWKELEKFLGMSLEDSDTSGDRVSGDVGHQLKSDTRWKDGGNGDNSSKFDALPGGRLMYVDWMGFNYLGEAAFFWSSTLDANVRPWYRILSNTSDGVSRVMNYSRDLAYSVRCVKNN